MSNSFQGSITGEGYGYVYIMSYPNSDKVKIGHALNPTARAKDIGGTLAPEQPVVEVTFWCSERREAVERAAHAIAKGQRHNGEWFALPVFMAVSVVQQAAASVGVNVQLAFDRNEWEAAAAAKLAEQLAALPTMSDDQVNTTCGKLFAAVANGGKPVQFTDAYEVAVMREYIKRKAEREAEQAKQQAKQRAEQQAKQQAEQQAKQQAAEKVRKSRFVAGWVIAFVFSLSTVSVLVFGDVSMQTGEMAFACLLSALFGVMLALMNWPQSDQRTSQVNTIIRKYTNQGETA